MTVVNAENYYQEHFFNGKHRNLVDLPGFGGDDGKAIVFADQYPGANMGAKINAALADVSGTGAKVIIPPGAHVGTVTVTMVSDATIEWLPGATYTANGNFPAFTIPLAASKTIFINPQITGSNNVANTLNVGLLFAANAGNCKVYGGRLYRLYDGMQNGFGSNGNNILVVGTEAVECKRYGFALSCAANGTTYPGGLRMLGCYARDCITIGFVIGGMAEVNACNAYNCATGFRSLYTYRGVIFTNCNTLNCTTGFNLGYSFAAATQKAVGCTAIGGNYGFLATSVTTADLSVMFEGCTAWNCAVRGFSTADNASYNLHLTLMGNVAICTGTQAYAFWFGRSVKKLIYIGNDASGFSTAAEYWHPALNKGDYEIGHNFVG